MTEHDYFDKIWPEIDFNNRKDILELLASRKGVIPYEKKEIFTVLIFHPKMEIFFEKSEFF